MTNNRTIFSFDVGLGSLGEAVRTGDDIVHADSLLIDAGVASIQDQAVRRRQLRTRQTHKAREIWWEKIWQSIGKEPLRGMRIQKNNKEWVVHPGDMRLEREFPETGDDTLYTSCLLRIALLEGKKLEDWQIFKAIRSAFARAGYPNVPWANNPDNKKNDEQESKNRSQEFIQHLATTFSKPEQRFPCYYDAYMMGLFNPQSGDINIRQNHLAKRARGGYIAPRDLVEKEIRLLLDQAAKQIPALKTVHRDNWQEFVLYGEGLKPFYDNKIEGIIDQKIARFDNRCINSCSVLPAPRFKTSRAKQVLYFQAHFLIKLRNMLIEKHDAQGLITACKLNTDEIREWYDRAETARKKYMTDFMLQKKQYAKAEIDFAALAKCYRATKTEWKKWVADKNYRVHKATGEIPMPKLSGRTGFSRAALVLFRELILSGLGPHDFRDQLIKSDFKGYENLNLQKEDLDFLSRMKDNDPTKIYIAPLSLADKYHDKTTGDVEAAVHKIIGSTRNSVVRHRLEVFFKRLQALTAKYGTPDGIVIEFAREDFMPAKKKQEYESRSRENNKLYEDAKTKLKEIYGESGGDIGRDYVSKYIMGEKQGRECPYTGQSLCPSKLDQYEIEHIIPQRGKWHGPDAIENKVLTTWQTNKEKGDRMPFEFIKPEDWQVFKERVDSMHISGKTKRILQCTSAEQAEELIERYYGLATTSWVARLARDIACIWFGWQPNAEGEKQKMHVVSGSLVGKMRRKYGLNKALNPFLSAEDAKKDEKNREDQRHHALDAMVMTYLEEYARNIRNFDKLELPENRRDANYFEKKLETVTPRKVARTKARLNAQPICSNKKRIIDLTKSDIADILDNSMQQAIISEGLENFKMHAHPNKIVLLRPYGAINLSKNKKTKPQWFDTKTGEGFSYEGCYFYFKNEKLNIRPIFAFESAYLVKQELIKNGFEIKDDAVFYAGCFINITKPVESKDIDIGIYKVKQIRASDNRIQVQSMRGEKSPLFAISYLGNNFHFFR